MTKIQDLKTSTLIFGDSEEFAQNVDELAKQLERHAMDEFGVTELANCITRLCKTLSYEAFKQGVKEERR